MNNFLVRVEAVWTKENILAKILEIFIITKLVTVQAAYSCEKKHLQAI
jgi:hypothetical protein